MRGGGPRVLCARRRTEKKETARIRHKSGGFSFWEHFLISFSNKEYFGNKKHLQKHPNNLREMSVFSAGSREL